MRTFYKHITPLFILLTSLSLFGQENETEEYEKNVYRKSWNIGGLVHTRGFGLNFRNETFKTARIKNFWTVEAYNIKHPKQQKSFGSSGDDSKSFVYGKLNSVYVLKGGVGRQKELFGKEVIRGVQISTVYNINFNLGFLKPVYLEVFKRDEEGRVYTSTERYDPDVHTLNQISGKAPWINGTDKMSLAPGLGAKFALNFEFAPQDEKIKAIEMGVNVDAFFQPVPIMANQKDQYVFVNMYINFQFGRKSYL